MGIRLAGGSRDRNWSSVAACAAEVAIQGFVLGYIGFSNAVSAFFRFIEGIRGNDSIELRANTLIMETLAYAVSSVVARGRFERRPKKAEVEAIIEGFLTRASILADSSGVELESEHLVYPARLSLFHDAASRISHDLKDYVPDESPDDLASRFQSAVADGLNRIRTRQPSYFSEVVNALSGPDAQANAQARAWDQYRAELVRRFEDAPLFAEDDHSGVTLGRVYQPLRSWWHVFIEEDTGENLDFPVRTKKRFYREVHVGRIELEIDNWLGRYDKKDTIRFISGGPGSGKSTFAKWLAAHLAVLPKWRVLLVPLQRLRGAGPLESRVNEYFRVHSDEPFQADTLPMNVIGRDGHKDWLFIFDGLDELAKEGPGSESAAQDFALAVADMNVRLSSAGQVRFLVLGRAPSMQEARRRLGLEGERTQHVADMLPQVFERGQASEVRVLDPNCWGGQDQREEFWKRWALAKDISLVPPEAIKTPALDDLTKEPLLAYLLIKSGYASDRWHEAAENRNRIYEAIFRKIWERERTKETRRHLNDIGKVGFDALMQALGLAAWRGGGRTGDEATFVSIRDVFVRQDILRLAKSTGVANLDNIAVLFYTQKDESGGRGYEFLHKSFGEYLTACGLADAFIRWGAQVEAADIDFDEYEFSRRWLVLTGPVEMTRDISEFLRNEFELRAQGADSIAPWLPARKWAATASKLFSYAMEKGVPAHEGAVNWREAEAAELHAEQALLLLLNSCGHVAFPDALFGVPPTEGGWEAGPLRVEYFFSNPLFFNELLHRLKLSRPYIPYDDGNLFIRDFTRFDLSASYIHSGRGSLDFEGARLDGCDFSNLIAFNSNFRNASLRNCSAIGGYFRSAHLENADLSGSVLRHSMFDEANCKNARFNHSDLEYANFSLADLSRADFSKANLSHAEFSESKIEDISITDAVISSGAFDNALKLGENLTEAREARRRGRFAKEHEPKA